jgi:hypothetical protein
MEVNKLVGVLHDKWPCCNRSCRWHNMTTTYKPGDEIERTCTKDGRTWTIGFSEAVVGGMHLLKLTWEEVNPRQKRRT